MSSERIIDYRSQMGKFSGLSNWEKNDYKKSQNTNNSIDIEEYEKIIKSSGIGYKVNEYYYTSLGNNLTNQYFKTKLNTNSSANKKGDEKIMDDGYKKLLDRLDQDFRDHKCETRDRDAKIQLEMQEREKRYHDELREREERIHDAINRVSGQIQSDIHEMKSSIQSSEKHIQSMVTQNFWGRIGTIIAIIAICATVAATVWAATKTASPASTSFENTIIIEQLIESFV